MKPVLSFFMMVSLVIYFASCNNNESKQATTGNHAKDSSKIIIPGKNDMPYVDVDISPMDMIYFPADYPLQKMSKANNMPPLARIIYSRPHLQGRKLFQTLLKYGEPWRLGANESTELALYSDAFIRDKKVKAGRYVLYCIPDTSNWNIILNSNIDSWGLHPDSTKDIARFTIPVKQTVNQLEYFTMVFEKTNQGAELLMAWDNLEARLPFRF
ncbi:MAG: DUF2911 domain-containing protein [Chitinophagaceae bacterium]